MPMTIITEELNFDRVKQQYTNRLAMDPTKVNVARLDASKVVTRLLLPCYRRQNSNGTPTSTKYHVESQTKVANEDLDFEIYKDKRITSTLRRCW